jgi:cell shape-determining protein MreC
MARYSRFLFIFSFCLVSPFLFSQQVKADAVSDLQGIFGDPDQFVTNFENSIKDKSNQVVGLFLAATGFSLVVRAFTK